MLKKSNINREKTRFPDKNDDDDDDDDNDDDDDDDDVQSLHAIVACSVRSVR